MDTYVLGSRSNVDTTARSPVVFVTIVGLGLVMLRVGLLSDATAPILALLVVATLLRVSVDKSIGGLLLVMISFHVMVSYLGSTILGPTGVPPQNNVVGYILESFKIFILGISCSIVGYGLTKRFKPTWRAPVLDVTRLDRMALLATVAGSVILGYVIYRVGFLEMMLTGNFVRYFGEEQAGSNAGFYQSLMRRGLAILVGSVPILVVRWPATRSNLMLAIGLIGVAFMGASTRRGSLAVVVATIALTNVILGKNLKPILVFGLAVAVLFLFLQALFIPSVIESSSALATVGILASTVMTEVNDFGYLLSEWDHQLFYGATWAAAMWPVPSSISSFKDTYALALLTKDIVGIPREAEHGGLRILIFGEAFVNFGYCGVIVVGLIYGVLLQIMNGIFAWVRGREAPIVLLVTSVFILLFGQMYLSGSAVFSDAALTIITIVTIYWLSSTNCLKANRSSKL